MNPNSTRAAGSDNLHILLVDDDSVDRELFVDAINQGGKMCDISEASNGEEAIRFLNSSNHLPHLIFLDLNMPIKDGRETLREIKAQPSYKNIPVCVMSTSNARFDVQGAYEAGANLFLVKPLDFKDMIDMLSGLLNLFGKYVSLIHPAGSKI